MADPDADHNLLERLNALKATNVTLDRSSNALDIPSSGIEPAAPPSREDALSTRLRTLRNRPQGSVATAAATTTTATTPSPPYAQKTSSTSAEDPPPPYAEVDGVALPRRQERGESAQTGRALGSVAGAGSTGSAPFQGGGAGITVGGADVDDLDELLGAGATQSLDDILESLDDVDEDTWPSVPSGGNGDYDDEPTRVAELLAKLQDDPPFQVIKADRQEWKKGGGEDEDGIADDSEGELMKREIDNVIAKALDEVHLGETMPEEEKSDKELSNEADKERKSGEDFSLPSAPTNLHDDDSEQDASTDEDTNTDDDDDDDSSEDEDSSEGDSRGRVSTRKQKGKKRRRLKLPDAPVRIWDPAVSTEKNFETDIQRRMAFLKRLNGPLEMPSVPTFKPEDKPGKGAP